MAERTTIRAELNTSLGVKTMRGIARRLGDRPHLLEKVAEFAQEWENEVWDSGGAATGKPWEPLKNHPGRRPLERTGVLKRALTGEPRRLSASVQIRGPEYGIHLRTGRFYSDGSGRGGNMPKRNPTPHPDRYQLAKLIETLLSEATGED